MCLHVIGNTVKLAFVISPGSMPRRRFSLVTLSKPAPAITPIQVADPLVSWSVDSYSDDSTGHQRDVPLSSRRRDLLEQIPRSVLIRR